MEGVVTGCQEGSLVECKLHVHTPTLSFRHDTEDEPVWMNQCNLRGGGANGRRGGHGRASGQAQGQADIKKVRRKRHHVDTYARAHKYRHILYTQTTHKIHIDIN